MALFKKEKKTEETKAADAPASPKKQASKQKSASPAAPAKRDVTYVLRQPRITEKATFAAENNVYVFEVADWANKKEIAHAIEHTYKVRPRKVNVVKMKSRQLRSNFRREIGTKKGGKKAYVYLKEGDRIEFV